ncbi:MAG: HAD family phosphatase [Spirochaetaceae bacterium]|nr:MAG: HAD family phosphatase [Spirochaetaceae bacterium]
MNRNILFDFGNVLYTFDYNRFFRAVALHSPFSASELQQMVFQDLSRDSIAWRFETGRMKAGEFVRRLQDEGGVTLEGPRIEELFIDIFTPNEPVLELAARLAGRTRIALVSNTNELHFERFIRHTPLYPLFSAVGLSCRAGAMKPEEPVFHAVLEQLQCPAGDCIFIDDLAENVAGARALGFIGIHYGPGMDLEPAIEAAVSEAAAIEAAGSDGSGTFTPDTHPE